MLSSLKSTRSSLLSPGQPGITVLLSCCRTCQVPSADSWHSKVHRLTHYTKGTMLVAVVNRNDILPPFCKIHMCQKVGYIPHRNSGACLLGDTSRGLVMWHLSSPSMAVGKFLHLTASSEKGETKPKKSILSVLESVFISAHVVPMLIY